MITTKKTLRSSLKKKSLKKAIIKPKKVFTGYRTLVLSRHPSHQGLRTQLPKLPYRSLVRLGSETSKIDKPRIEINSVQAVRNSASKLLMKRCFTQAGVKTADWFQGNDQTALYSWSTDKYPIIAKPIHGSRGNGICLIKDEKSLDQFLQGHNFTHYVIEKYYNFTREYRLHVSKFGCFYTCRKMLKSDIPENKRHIRNDSTCSWFLESNPQFNKPANWQVIIDECVKALKAVGLDIGAFDVRVQSEKQKSGKARKECDFIIIESGSAPSFGDQTLQKYLVEIPRLIKDKYVISKHI